MRKILFTILLCTCALFYSKNIHSNVIVNDKIEQDSCQNDWQIVINAIIQQESKGNVKAVSRDGKSCGILQITPICVKECNQILKRKSSNKRFTLKDRFNKEKSLEMFDIIQNNYNPNKDKEKAMRLWNGGCNFSKSKTNGYYKKVIKIYNILKEDKN